MNSFLESAKRAMRSTIAIAVSGIILSGLVLYSLIQLFKQFEIYILQNYEFAESILTTVYLLLAVGGLAALYFILKTRGHPKIKAPEIKVKHEPVEAAISGFMSGFVAGMKEQKRQRELQQTLRLVRRA